MIVEDVRVKFNLFLVLNVVIFRFESVCHKQERILFDDCKLLFLLRYCQFVTRVEKREHCGSSGKMQNLQLKMLLTYCIEQSPS